MNDFSVVRQGIKGGPPFSVNGRAVETLADEALDRIKAELIRLRNYHQDPVEVARLREERDRYYREIVRLRERIKELESFRNGENNEWWMAELTKLREDLKYVEDHDQANRNRYLEAENARLREIADKQAVALMKEIDEKDDELAQVREAANAEMKASLGYQAELARLREENKQLLLTKAGAFKAQMEYAEENARLREDVANRDDAMQDALRKLARLREEIAERQVNLDGWADRAEEAEAELTGLRESESKWANEASERTAELARVRENAVMDERRLKYLSDERDRLREALKDIRANGGGRDFDAAARADDALREAN